MENRLIRKRRGAGLYGIAIYAGLMLVILVVASLQGCNKMVLFDDTVTYKGGDTPVVTDSVRCAVTPCDGIVNREGILLEEPSVLVRVVTGPDLLYYATYSIDGDDVQTFGDMRKGREYALDCSGHIEPGEHDVSGVVTNGVERQRFSVTYGVVADTLESKLIRYTIYSVDGVLNRDSSVRISPKVYLKVIRGADTDYTVRYSIDDSDPVTVEDISRGQEYAINCDSHRGIGHHVVSGTVFNEYTSKVFSAEYSVTLDTLNYVVYGDPVIKMTAQDIPAGGGTAQVAVTYSQTQTRYVQGVPVDSLITTGGKVTLSDVLTAESLGSTITAEKTNIGKMYATVTVNGRTAQDSVTVYQAVNAILSTSLDCGSGVLQIGSRFSSLEAKFTGKLSSGYDGTLDCDYVLSNPDRATISGNMIYAKSCPSIDGIPFTISARREGKVLNSCSLKIYPKYESLDFTIRYKADDRPRVWVWWVTTRRHSSDDWTKDNLWDYQATLYYRESDSGNTMTADVSTKVILVSSVPANRFRLDTAKQKLVAVEDSSSPVQSKDIAEESVILTTCYPEKSEHYDAAIQSQTVKYRYGERDE